MSILVWSNFACIDDTLGLAGLIARTTCLSVRAIGTDPVIERAIELWLLVGEVGVAGTDSSAEGTLQSLGQALVCLCIGGTQKVVSSADPELLLIE